MPAPQNPYFLRSIPETNGGANQLQEAAINDVQQEVVIGEQQQEVDQVSMAQIQMACFHGNPGERADEWLSWYVNYAEAMQFNDDKRRLFMPFYSRDHAKVWYDSLPADTKNNWRTLTNVFKDKFNGSDGLANEATILNIRQNAEESCASYFTRFTRATTNKNIPEAILAGVVLNGLRPEIKQIVMPQDPKTVEDVRKIACLGERTVAETSAGISVSYWKGTISGLPNRQIRGSVVSKYSVVEWTKNSFCSCVSTADLESKERTATAAATGAATPRKDRRPSQPSPDDRMRVLWR